MIKTKGHQRSHWGLKGRTHYINCLGLWPLKKESTPFTSFLLRVLMEIITTHVLRKEMYQFLQGQTKYVFPLLKNSENSKKYQGIIRKSTLTRKHTYRRQPRPRQRANFGNLCPPQCIKRRGLLEANVSKKEKSSVMRLNSLLFDHLVGQSFSSIIIASFWKSLLKYPGM